MKKLFLFVMAIALLAVPAGAVFKNVVCARTLSEDFAAMGIGDCVKTERNFTVQLVSLQQSPDAATFRTFTPDGDPLKDTVLSATGKKQLLDREAFVGYDSIVPGG
ncbi:MAG: hypothetical protein Q8P02_02665, partial [Candidatus Micrarchaeota archaeon]|nr:hypothetical protein [Candidatus Micrarchaeota archaeon]